MTGLKAIATVQLVPAATVTKEVPPQLPPETATKSLPPLENMLTVTATAPVLLRVMFWDALVVLTSCTPKFVRLAGVTVSVPVGGGGAGATTFTVSGTSCGELVSLSMMFSVAVSVLAAVGVACTAIAQVACGSSSGPHEFASKKSAAFGPVNVMLVMVRVLVPLSKVTIEYGEALLSAVVRSVSADGNTWGPAGVV